MSGVRRPRVRQTALRLSMRVWDAPTRLFHWAIVLLIATSYFSIRYDKIALHLLSGYTLMTLLLFRLAWGFVGSETSRFRQFLRSPVEAFRHLAHFARREEDNEIGHNAAGGWMVLVLLGDLAVQVGLGLCSNDDGATEGPLAHVVGKDMSDRLTAYHATNFNILLGLICLHVLAVIGYGVVKRHNLLRPMITGRKRLPGATRQPRMASPLLALLVLALSAVIVWIVATRV
ncbi:cytochrome b/b6 domain-containing protein [Acidisphaera sp. L21]|uniref:cytochrome b/b6 domain-containing protein n=1 Tax=Acidisphaera sp. L21 TaxID=1641851 RepID=UPI00131A668F|nr:cytochrome b/b6 domain-containing protein [Acidisphaera sp. L21]